jgi:hypothetical protein
MCPVKRWQNKKFFTQEYALALNAMLCFMTENMMKHWDLNLFNFFIFVFLCSKNESSHES